MAKLAGFIILGLSVFIWLMIPVVPFLGFSVAKIAGITTGLIVAGEVTFYLGLFLVGKEFLVKIKSWFKRRKNPSETPADSTDSE